MVTFLDNIVLCTIKNYIYIYIIHFDQQKLIHTFLALTESYFIKKISWACFIITVKIRLLSATYNYYHKKLSSSRLFICVQTIFAKAKLLVSIITIACTYTWCLYMANKGRSFFKMGQWHKKDILDIEYMSQYYVMVTYSYWWLSIFSVNKWRQCSFPQDRKK